MTKKRLSFKFLWMSVLILLISNLQAGAETALKYPPDKSITPAEKIRFIGLADAGATVKVDINNSNEKNTSSLQVKNGAFSGVMELAPGLNQFSITIGDSQKISRTLYYLTRDNMQNAPPDFSRLFIHSRNDMTETCGDCHIVTQDGPVNYTYIEQKPICMTAECHQGMGKKKFVHGPVKENFCVGCHNPHGTSYRNFLIGMRDELCNSCHSTMDEITPTTVVHFPVAKGECLSCHEPHESDLEFHLKRGSIIELCAGCHGRSYTQHEVMHDPVESEDCIACHAPHISQFEHLLYDDGNNMCFTCHEIRKDEFQARHIHEPVKKDCNLCHDPHGSAAAFHLKTKMDENKRYIKVDNPQKELCLSCHTKLDPQVIAQITEAEYKHKPVAEGKCTLCHTPHSTNFQKQLKHSLTETCFPCHEDMKKLLTESPYKHGPVRNNDCAQCHAVHGSNHKHLLTANFSDKLYGDFDLKNFALCLNCHNKKVVTEERSYDTGFRNGDQNLHYEHVNRKKKSRNCITCHDIHASEQEKHIRSKIPYKKRFTISLQFTKTDTGGGCVVGCHKPRDYDRETPVKYKKGKK